MTLVLSGPRGRLRPRALVPALATFWFLYVLAQGAFSGTFWVWLLFDIAPPFGFVVVPLVLLGLARFTARRRRVVVLALLSLLLGLPHSGLNPHAVLGGGDGPAPPGALKVFSWNTEYWDEADGADEFYAFLKRQNADVYLLQEYLNWDFRTGTDGLWRGPRSAGDLQRLRQEFPGYTIVARGELLTLSKLKVLGVRPVGPDPGELPGEDWWKVFEAAKVLRTDLLYRGSALSVYNVHIPMQLSQRTLLSPGFYLDVNDNDLKRRAQFEGLHADLSANPYPSVVAGDFNTTPAMGDMRWLTSVATDALRANRSLYPQTWRDDVWMPFWRLDWAFTRGSVRVHSYEFGSPEKMSDHRTQELTVSV
ncbi:hypothetical protein Lfu02_65120 [Longispora fulva]|uniref:Endonuclease/exonuclease/phosphatase (EEP) superfamily protein YafD n=1 Tax=Longispora fulva TaxID=619741 RepID=A0A8J7KK65_9ACTN|nr:endonuclease/exonuclease/phosphatase family protein [Longispora fulva]MBG6137704.1 endonuclease/exonuclease/phosphatase (EEP) superfamily protein YafD [Longispora fulva]GIG62140.1 hypothetical protein Lfu02_65120 [Longispora fulva]